MKRTFFATTILAVAIASAAVAQSVPKGPNGGPVVNSDGHYVEMTTSGSELVLFLTEAADKPLASASTKNARAVIQDGGKTATVPLSSQEPNKLVGALSQPLGKGARVVFSATLVDGHALQARFVNN